MFNRSVFRTTTFRLTAALGATFALGVLLLLGMIYQQTAGYLSRRVDGILNVEAVRLVAAGPTAIQGVVRQRAARDPVMSVGLFSPSGERLAGEASLNPSDMPLDGAVRDFAPHDGGQPHRALGKRLPWGQILIVERDAGQFVEVRRIILGALIWSGATILILGGFLSVALSLPSLRRVQAMQVASDAVAHGDLKARLPVDGRQDELDQLAEIVNRMVDEVERFMTQARTVGEGVAHELRTPLTRLRNALDHAAAGFEPDDHRSHLLNKCIVEADGVIARFHALLRIAALEARSRESGIARACLSDLIQQLGELYEPLAYDREVAFTYAAPSGVYVRADGELLFEAVSNLVDNALKFTPAGGAVNLKLAMTEAGPEIQVRDNGQGIPDDDLALVTRRLFRSQGAANVPGFGLGLSLVTAVANLHRFKFTLESAAPGVCARLLCVRGSA